MKNLLEFVRQRLLLVLFSLVVVVGIVLYILLRPPAVVPLAVISSTPSEGTSYNPFLPVTIVFNRPPTPKEYSVVVTPTTDVSIISITSSSIQIKPISMFLPETQYAVSVSTNPPYILRFTTQQAIDNAPGWNTMFNQIEQNNQQKYATQGAALENIRKSVPITLPGFAVNYSYDSDVYTVMLSQPYDQNKTNFLSWLAQRGVSDATSVVIRYINQ
ncbi:MAG TPA: hypothetical protein VMR81_01950 [Patescibacteria group bacterium]|nr:hypothetical protein [Patescibacteria group bacterium]